MTQSTTHIRVNESILRWAVLRSGRPATIESKFPKLEKWLIGEVHPTLRDVEKLAKATCTPLGYFFLQSPPEEKLPIPHFRTLADQQLRSQPSPDLIETIQTMERRQSWMREYLLIRDNEPLSFVKSVKIEDEPEKIANKIKISLGLSDTWASEQPNWSKALEYLRKKIESVGIILFVNGIVGNNTKRKLEVSEFRGFVLVDDYAPLIFVNGADGKAAQMFTLSHELAHIFLGQSAVFDLKKLQPADDLYEKKCNQVAAEFLIPKEQLLLFWNSIPDKSNIFQKIAKQFKVSEIVAAYRMLNLGLIRNPQFEEFYSDYISIERKKAAASQAGGDFFATQNVKISRNFGTAVVCATREGSLLFQDAYYLTGLKGDTFDKYAKNIEMC